MTEETIGVFLDFENLAVSADRVYPSREKPLKLTPVIDFINTLGNVLVKRAYANWSNPLFSQYQSDLSNNGFELTHLPETTVHGKNGSDVKLAIDLMEHMELYDTITTYIIGSGDSDFIPLIQSIRKRGKRVLIIGFDSSVGHVVKKVCNDYKSLESFLGRPEEDISMENDPEMERRQARELLLRYSRNLQAEEMGVLLSQLKMDLKRLDPSFSEEKCGFRSFKSFMESFQGDIVDIQEDPEKRSSYIAYFIERASGPGEEEDLTEEASTLLNKWGYIEDPKKRDFVAERMLEVISRQEHPSINEMTDLIYDGRKRISKRKITKFLLALFNENVFEQVNESYKGPLNTRWLRLRRKSMGKGEVLREYHDALTKILKEKFPDLGGEELEKLLE